MIPVSAPHLVEARNAAAHATAVAGASPWVFSTVSTRFRRCALARREQDRRCRCRQGVLYVSTFHVRGARSDAIGRRRTYLHLPAGKKGVFRYVTICKVLCTRASAANCEFETGMSDAQKKVVTGKEGLDEMCAPFISEVCVWGGDQWIESAGSGRDSTFQ